MNRIDDLKAFISIIEKESLTAAARHLGRSLQSISRSLADVEGQAGVELIKRTTRSVRPTEAGMAYYNNIKIALDLIEDATLAASHQRLEPKGLLRLSSPSDFGSTVLVPLISEFMKIYPKVEVTLTTYDRQVDLVEDTIDVAIQIGPVSSQALTIKLLANLRRCFFASPGYFAAHGRPRMPGDLIKHQCIVRTFRDGGNIWPYTWEGKVRPIKVAGKFSANSNDAIAKAASHGLGIAIGPYWHVKPLIEQHILETILNRYAPPTIPLYATWNATRVLPARTRVFIDFLAKQIKKQSL